MNSLYPAEFYNTYHLTGISPFLAQDLTKPVQLPRSMWSSQQMNEIYGHGFFSNLGKKFSGFFSRFSQIFKKSAPIVKKIAENHGGDLLNLGIQGIKSQIGEDTRGKQVAGNFLDTLNQGGQQFLADIDKNTTKTGARSFLVNQAKNFGKTAVKETRKEIPNIKNETGQKIAQFLTDQAGGIVGAGYTNFENPRDKLTKKMNRKHKKHRK